MLVAADDDEQPPITADGINEPLKKQKRNVALHVGYVGTSYTGAHCYSFLAY
jgi:hypothetical protein